jgi:hypothetical protein
MKTRFFTIACALSLVLCLCAVTLLVRSWVVTDHLASATNSGPAWVVRSFHARLSFEHRSYWDAQGGFTWGRRRLRFYDDPATYLYQEPSRAYGLMDAGFYSGTAYTWPGHLYPNVTLFPPVSDPRYWRDNYSALIVPDLMLITVFAILPGLYVRRRVRSRGVIPPRAAMPGRGWTVLAGESVVLFVCLSELWPRTYSTGHLWWRGWNRHVTQVNLFRNQIVMTSGVELGQNSWNDTGDRWRHVAFMGDSSGTAFVPRTTLEGVTGFAYRNQHPRYSRFHSVAIPLWPLWVLAALPPLRWVLLRRRARRRALRAINGECQSCGYSLRGNTTGVCPECGSEPRSEGSRSRNPYSLPFKSCDTDKPYYINGK